MFCCWLSWACTNQSVLHETLKLCLSGLPLFVLLTNSRGLKWLVFVLTHHLLTPCDVTLMQAREDLLTLTAHQSEQISSLKQQLEDEKAARARVGVFACCASHTHARTYAGQDCKSD